MATKILSVSLILLTIFFAVSDVYGLERAEAVHAADLIAIVTVTNVAKVASTNLLGREIPMYVADAVVQRSFKGEVLKTIRIQDLSERSYLSADDLCKGKGKGDTSKHWLLLTRRFLVCLKKSGDYYSNFGGDAGLYPVYGNGAGTDRVTFYGCRSMNETTSILQKQLSK